MFLVILGYYEVLNTNKERMAIDRERLFGTFTDDKGKRV